MYASFSRGMRNLAARPRSFSSSVVKYAPKGWSPGGWDALKVHVGWLEMALYPSSFVKWFIRAGVLA